MLEYYNQIESFYQWLAVNQQDHPSRRLKPVAVALYLALVSLARRNESFANIEADMLMLRCMTGAKRDAIYDARDQLQEHGLINFTKRKGRQPALYTLYSGKLASVFPTQTNVETLYSDKVVSLYPTQPATQTLHCPKVASDIATQILHRDKVASVFQTQNPFSSLICNKREEVEEVITKRYSILHQYCTKLGEINDELLEILSRVYPEDIPEDWVESILTAIVSMYHAPKVRINGEQVTHEVIRDELLQLNPDCIKYVIEQVEAAGGNVQNPIAYMKTLIFNARVNVDAKITAQVAKDTRAQSF